MTNSFRKFLLGAVAASLALGGTSAAFAKDKGDFLVRFRGLAFIPDESGTTDAIGGSDQVSDDYVPEIDFSYFFTENIAAELIVATTQHDVDVAGTALGRDVSLGSVRLLPPVLTLQYHFNPKGSFSPYLGAGVNYSFFYDVDKGDDPAVNSVDYENGFGYAFQAGIDYQIDEKWLLNFDVKKVMVGTDIKVNGGAINSDDVDLDPWIFGVGFGYRF